MKALKLANHARKHNVKTSNKKSLTLSNDLVDAFAIKLRDDLLGRKSGQNSSSVRYLPYEFYVFLVNDQ